MKLASRTSSKVAAFRADYRLPVPDPDFGIPGALAGAGHGWGSVGHHPATTPSLDPGAFAGTNLAPCRPSGDGGGPLSKTSGLPQFRGTAIYLVKGVKCKTGLIRWIGAMA